MSNEIRRAAALTPGQVRHLLRCTEATSQQPERDAVVLLLGLSVGMRVTEIALLPLREAMFSGGRLRTEVSLVEWVTKGTRQRTVYFSGRKLIDAIERYLALRVERDIGTTLDASKYRGLNPDLPLVLSRKGYPYAMNRKVRTSAAGERIDYWAADSLQAYVTRLYHSAGLKNASSHSGRRTFSTNLIKHGATVQQVQLLLGHADLDDCMRYIETDKEIMRKAFAEVI